MKKWFVFIFVVIFVFNISAQQIVVSSRPMSTSPKNDGSDMIVQDQATVRCYYVFTKQKSSTDKTLSVDTMALDTGSNVSFFYDPSRIQRDSIFGSILTNIDPSTVKSISVLKGQSTENLSSYPGTTSGINYNDGESAKIYKDKTSNKITVIDKMDGMFQYEDAIGILPWEIQSDTTTILSHLCQKAALKFRGRDYTAWFSQDIPINDGPWKFMGLPGLILKIEDSQRLFSFELIGIEQLISPRLIQVEKNENIVKCSRKDYEKQKKKQASGMQINVNGGNIVIAEMPGKYDYNPIELE